MSQFSQLLPAVAFFVVFYATNRSILWATAAIMALLSLQVGWQWLSGKPPGRTLLFTWGLVMVLGGITLALRDPLFIQWKPTLVSWGLAVALLGTQWLGKRPPLQMMLGAKVELPGPTWRRLGYIWAGNFILTGIANLYVAFNYDQSTWVNFKLFGLLGINLATVLLTLPLLWSRAGQLQETTSPGEPEAGEEKGVSS